VQQTHYFNGPPTWNGPFATQRWNYRVVCCGECPSAGYAPFGAGCVGTGSGGCLAANWGQPFAGNTGVLGNFAILSNTGAQPRAICSVDLFCQTVSGQPIQTNVWIYDRSASGQPGNILGTTTMMVSGSPAANTASFAPPVVIPAANTDFFVVIDNSVGLRLPICTAGTLETHYFNGPPTWNGPFSSVRWNYQVNCCGGGAIPQLTNTGRPAFNTSFTVNVVKAAPTTVAVLFTGFSNSTWNGIPLPFDLGQLGAPGCSLLAPGAVLQVANTDANGAGSTQVPVPNDASLCGAHAYQQWVILDPTANGLGFVTSNGGDARLGT
jgi:hypothetical protein